MSDYLVRRWTDDVNVSFEIGICRHENTRGQALVVTFSGTYWAPGSRHEAASFMRMVVGAALSEPREPGRGLVVDLRGLQYSGGDNLFNWAGLVHKYRFPDTYRLALVWSDLNRVAIASLIEHYGKDEVSVSCFDTPKDALDYVFAER